MPYLLKTEPSEYSFADLERDKSTVWDGVSNPVALKYLRGMAAGDELIIYHTGEERRTVGAAVVVSVDNGDGRNPRVTIRAGKKLNPVTLAEIKANKLFSDSPLLRQGRLSVVPLSQAQHNFLVER
ncbi:MAG: EVE domain-containing protein [Chlamydiota bacterium]